MRKKIHTVLGNIEPECAGFTQCHEHLLISRGKSYEINKALYMADLDKSAEEVKHFLGKGGCTLVEAQPAGCNRMTDGLVQIARDTGAHIIASTGFHKLEFYQKDHWIRSIGEKQLAQLFISELMEGMYLDLDEKCHSRQQKACAGILKTALDSCNLSVDYERLFRSAVRAHCETGAPMMVHIEKGSSPEKLAEELKKWEADPGKIYFCHMDRACGDIETLKKVLDYGISLEFDTIGRFKYHSDVRELELIRQILDWGYENQLLFSLDTTRERLKTYTPKGVGLTYILETFLPAMRESGITERQIEKISVENPARILAW